VNWMAVGKPFSPNPLGTDRAGCPAMILIMASEGRVGACPKGKRSRC
jgi:hypothetical protein